MTDWSWLWVVGECGLAYGFYRWWKKDDTFVAVFEVAPEINIDELKSLSASTTSIDFATVRGLVQSNDSQAQSILRSEFVPNCLGVIRRLTIHDRKMERARSVWNETKKTISDLTRSVPFRLVTPKGNAIRIEKPLDFHSIQDQLEVVHVKFDPSTSSSAERIVDTLIGKFSTGVETKEHMLLLEVPLTGVGRLEKRSRSWFLIPHEQWGGILSRLSRAELLDNYRTRATILRYLSIIFGLAAGVTTIYLIYQFYSKQRREQVNRAPPRVPPVERVVDTNEPENPNNRLLCVICLENEIMFSLQPCSHLGLCQTCVQQLQRRDRAEQSCPLCRQRIEQYQRIFLP